MIAMRLVALFAYTAIGAIIGGFLSFPFYPSLNPIVCILGGAAVGLAFGLAAWVKATRER